MTTWFRDYLYIPIGGSKGSLFLTIRNISIVFLVSGLWHGAKWTFLFWGIVHVLAYIIFFLIKIKNKNRGLRNRLYTLLGAISTFVFVMLSWVFFRSETITDSFQYLMKLFSFQKNNEIIYNPANNLRAEFYIIYILFFLLFDFYLSKLFKEKKIIERTINIVLLILILFFVQIDVSESFIYFQF